MRNLFLAASAAAALLGASMAAGGAQAAPSPQPSPQLIFGVDGAGNMPTLDRVQYVFGGHNFCWYDAGWQGPGFYWCGYAQRRGMGWGGGAGFHGWQRGGGGHASMGVRNAGSVGHAAANRGGARMASARGAVSRSGARHATGHATASHGAGHPASDDHKPG